MEPRRLARTAAMLGLILAVVGLMAWSIIAKLTLTPQATAEDLQALPLWMIPPHYLWDYAQHGWLCLGFAFIVSGLFQEFLPQDTMIRYMGSGDWRAYVFATVLAPVFCVCSCTMVPIFAGLVYAGSGIGPALTFLLVAPANNLLADIITVQVMGWPIALADMVAGAASAIAIGYIVSRTPWGREFEERFTSGVKAKASMDLMEEPLDDRLWNALKFGGYLAKQIVPTFLVGLVVVSYFQAYFPEDLVRTWLSGPRGVVVAALLGGPLYTPTLIEVVLGKALMDLGMSPAATVAWLMGQPYDIPNSLSASRVVGWRIVATYGPLAFISAVLSGLVYGLLTGGF
ncbi:permease [Candidatus Bathyarchaeota archaeon]|nr:permease [Candidatus Bathyarchaeota archaeon]